MSAETSRDMSSIQDEDTLRKMWQETEDFGVKKEIRSHMYKLREQRLKEFYNNGDTTTEIKTTTTTSGGKNRETPTHADSIADHSFLSLKSKEIRDSESPTRDLSYKITDKNNDQGWQVVTSNERSADGKTHITKRTAATSGSQKIDGGKIDYAAKNDQVASVFREGDDKNFTKSVGAQSNTVIQQEAVGGDENSNFKTSSTKTSSSSRVVTESKSTTGDDVQSIPSNVDHSTVVNRKIYTENVPNDLKNHPSYVEGRTKVTRETKTLPDGSTVTTTRYETKGENTSQSSSTSKFSTTASSSTEQRSSSTSSQVHSSKSDRRDIRDNSKAIEYITDQPEYTVQVIKNDDNRATNRTQRFTDEFVDVRSAKDHSHHVDVKSHHHQDIKVVRGHYENEDVKNQKNVDHHVERKVNVVHENYDNRKIINENLDKEIVQHSNQDIRRRQSNDVQGTSHQKIVRETTESTVNVVKQSVNNQDIRNERNEQVERNVNVRVIKDGVEVYNTDAPKDLVPVDKSTIHTTTTVKTIRTEPVESVTKHTTTTTHNQRQDKKVVNDQFINIERQHEVDTRQITQTMPREPSPVKSPERRPIESSPERKPQRPTNEPSPVRQPKGEPQPYQQPERRQPIKPGKSELDEPIKPTDGQYDTTYRTDFTSKKISVEVSATHDAFARSLRAITPERTPSKCSTPTRGSTKNLRTSTSSLRSSTSPEKNRHPSRLSPDRQSPRRSPEKKSPSPQRVVNSDTITRRKTDNITATRTDTTTRQHNTVTSEIDSSTLTRRKKPRSRSPSPISTIASDIEFIRNVQDVTTDLDEETHVSTTTRKDVQKDTRPSSLEITTKKSRKITERSPTSPLTSPKKSPTKDQSPRTISRSNSLRSPTKEPSEKPSRYYAPDERPLKRTDTYEERCRQILGITETSEKRRGSIERSSIRRTSTPKDTVRSPSTETPRRIVKPLDKSPTKSSPDLKSPTKDRPGDFSPFRKSPEAKSPSKVSEFPSQVRKSPEKQQLPVYPERKSPTKEGPKVSEFPSQIRKSPEKQPLEPYPERKSPTKEVSKISEFPSQTRKSPERQPLEPYPERKSPTKDGPKISEFPSQIRKSPEREPLEPYPERTSPTKDAPKISEFPSQIRKSPEKQPLEPYPERKSPTKDAPKISEFPSQVRKSPEREPLEPYPEKDRAIKEGPKISEFPSQIRKSPEREPLEPYPERKSPTKEGPKICEFPSQIRRSPEREPLEPYPERDRPVNEGPKISEFPSQVRKSPVKEPLEPYPERKSPIKEGPNVSEFPSQIRKSPQKEPLEPYPEKKSPTKEGPHISEFPSQIKKSPQKEPLESYPERKSPTKEGPNISEFPSQIKKSPQKEPLEPYPERKRPIKGGPTVSEFPSQIRKSPEKEPLEPYLQKQQPTKEAPKVSEFPSHIRKSPEKEHLVPEFDGPQTNKKEPTGVQPIKKQPQNAKPQVQEFPSQTRKPTQKEPLEPYPEKKAPKKEAPTISEFPSQVNKPKQKDVPEKPTDEKQPVSQVKTTTVNGRAPTKLRPQVEQFPSSPRKPKTKKQPKDSSDSSSDEEEIEETVTETTVTTLENKIPINEPEVTKKFISTLCREDEVSKTDVTKITTEELLEREILESGRTNVTNKTVKKDQPKTPRKPDVEEFIKTEKNTTTITSQTPREKSPVKKPLSEKPQERKPSQLTTTVTKKVVKETVKSPVKKQPEIHKVEKTKFIGQTEYTDQYSTTKTKQVPRDNRRPQKTSERITLYDIEKLNDNREDTKVHIRTHRIDDTINKKTTANVIVNGDYTNKPKTYSPRQPTTITKISPKPGNQVSPTRKPTQTKPEEPKGKTVTQSKYTTTVRKNIINATDYISKSKTTKPLDVTTTTTTVRKTLNVTSPASKPKQQKPEQIIPKKHTVTATITVSPKTKPVTKQTNKSTTVTSRTTKVIQSKPKAVQPTKIQNGHFTSDSEDESEVDSLEGSIIDLTVERNEEERTFHSRDEKIDRRTTTRTNYGRATPESDVPKSKSFRKPEKCITTKTVIINNKDNNEREIIVDLQRSKSSREPTPDRVCPVPLSSDEDTGAPRYPDNISEPEDGSLKRKPKRLSDIPILEGQDTTEFTQITEVTDTKKITEVDKVDETDESLLSVNKKISKFLSTTDQVTKPLKSAPKVDRPPVEVSDDLRSDECLLSVSDKVSKFISTAEQLITTQQQPERPKSPRCQNYPDSSTKVSEKVSHFLNTSKEVSQPKKPAQGPAPKVQRPELIDVDENIREDDCLLSVSDKVSKFISTADKLTKVDLKKPVSLAKIDVKPKQQEPSRKSPERKSPERKSPTRFIPSALSEIDVDEVNRKSLSPERRSPIRRTQSPEDRTPTRRPSNQYSISVETQETKYSRRDSSPKLPDSTPKSAKRPSVEEPKQVLSPTGRLRSTESIKKAKALFETINKEQEVLRQRDILSRPSVFEGKTKKPEESKPRDTKLVTRKRLSYSDEEDQVITHKTTTSSRDTSLKSTKLVLDKVRSISRSPEKDRSRSRTPDTIKSRRTPDHDIPHYMTPLDRNAPERDRSRSKTPDALSRSIERDQTPERTDVPHYMLPLDRSLRPNSPHRDNLTHPTAPPSQPEEHKTTKFGVTLKRTDSGRVVTATSTTSERRKSSITLEKRVTEEEIEDIFELEVLEELLEKVVGYELRRKIRTQIRLVKKLIAENRLTIYVASRKGTGRESRSPTKEKTHDDTFTDVKKTTEYQSKYTKKSSPERKIADNKLYQHTNLTHSETIEKKSEYQSSYSYNERKTSSDSVTKTTKSHSPQRGKSPDKSNRTSPDRKTKTDTKKTFTQLKKTTPASKPVEDDKPEWARQRNLRKTSETTAPTNRKVTTTTTTTTRKESLRSSSPAKETKPTDLITSSYGVGPTDENGTPLFGLKALRAQNKTSTTKVQGTVVTSEYYSENGKEPIGQVSVTKYSTDPKDLGTDQTTVKSKGITSVTTTQKFGYKDTPSLKSLTNKKKEITNEDSTKTSKVTRKNSVKALSQKFIDNAVETLKSERQTSYPKAGLILRTSSFKDSSSGTDDSRETSPANRQSESTVTVRTTTSTRSGDTFLTNKSRVSGVRDVISRMKTEDHQEGDTEEDIKARGLLNKFIGSQVILSGMESRTTTAKTATNSPGGTLKRTLKVTTTVTEGGKPVTRTRIFETPITEQELENIWDEQTLRLLLEQSTDYEERRVIRARLRQVMAEQEACTDLVEKASQDEQSGGAIEGESLLLPLLQGLLEAPETEQTADSGTESGEDQRNGLIAEVQNALDKLSASLRSDSTDITPERRCSLLQLVTKLQAGLSTTTPPKLERRQSSGQGRFGRRRQRQNRHTVGVSSEELADARRLMEEISLKDIPSQASNRVALLQKQNSESSVASNNSSFTKFGAKVAVKNATAKPFSSSNSISNNSSSVHTPTDPAENLDLLFGEVAKRPQYAVTQSASVSSLERSNSQGLQRTLSEATVDSTQEVDIKSVHDAVKAAARKKVASESAHDSETEEETSTVAISKEIEDTPPRSPLVENPVYCQPTENPIYSPPKEEIERKKSYDEKCNRFNTKAKKNKMKRANTIDIPKSQIFVDEDDDSEEEEEDEEQRRRNSYYALRGPIRVGNPVNKSTVPTFEPKTQSDQKFLSFLNRNNQNANNKTSVWAAHNDGGSVWGNKFGNLKNNFEKAASGSSNPARTFWKTADDTVTTGGVSQFGPKISKRSARNLQQMYEEKQRQTQEHSVVTGSLTLKTEPEKNYKFVPQPMPVNKFSHAPQSAFKPIPKKAPSSLPLEPATEIVKTELKEAKTDAPLYLYSPKSVLNSQNSSAATSPVVSSKPWITNASEHGGRVVNMAAKRFETPPQQDTTPIRPRKLSKDNYKVFIPQPAPAEKLTAPYLVKSAEQKGNTVRRLSGQYDSLGEKTPEYSCQATVKYQPPTPQPEKKHYVPKYTMPQDMVQSNSYQNGPFSPTKPKQQPFTSQNYQNYSKPQKSYNKAYDSAQSYERKNSLTNGYSSNQPYQNNYSVKYDQPSNVPQQTYQPAYKPQEFQPVNYSIVYDKPRPVSPPKETQIPASQQLRQKEERPIEEPEQQFTSTCQFTPKKTKNEPKQPSVKVSEPVEPPPKLQTQISNDSVHEYTAISSKVMTGPVSQQAVTVRQKSPMKRDEHDMEQAFNLRNSLQKVGPSKSPNNSLPASQSSSLKASEPDSIPQSNFRRELRDVNPKNYTKYSPSDVPRPTVCPSSFKSKTADHPWNQRTPGGESKTFGVVKPMQQKPAAIYNNVSGRMPSSQARESLEIDEKGRSVVTSKFHIPVINVNKSPNVPTQAQVLSKSDSWHQICMANQDVPSPRASPVGVLRSRSSHTLAVPQKQFEAGMSKEELVQKKKTIEAFFSGGAKSPTADQGKSKVVRRSINRIKTSEKTSAYRQQSGLARSRTLPDIICPEMLDESNVDKSFDDLFKSSS